MSAAFLLSASSRVCLGTTGLPRAKARTQKLILLYSLPIHHPPQLASSCFGPANAERLREYISSWREVLVQNLFLPLCHCPPGRLGVASAHTPSLRYYQSTSMYLSALVTVLAPAPHVCNPPLVSRDKFAPIAKVLRAPAKRRNWSF